MKVFKSAFVAAAICAMAGTSAFAAVPSFETDFTETAEKTVNAVVCIKNYATPQQSNYGYGDFNGGESPFDFFDFFFGNPRSQQQPRQQQRKQQQNQAPVQRGLGSGVILSADGYIITNNHVIDGADRVEVLLNDNSTFDAKVIGTDEASDLALLKIDTTGLSPIKFGNSDDLKVGEWVLAVGNPFGFNSTVTAGIVSAKGRSIGQARQSKMSIESFIQTDAALNPGNSGGALVNLKGELVGINAAIYSNTGSYSGFSFAIPTSIVSKVVSDLKEYGTVQRAVLGITIQELNSQLAEEKGITAVKSGMLVGSVNDLSTGKELGLEEDDVITAINGNSISKMAEIQEQLSKYRPGDSITVTFYRKNKQYTRTATLRNQQGNTSLVKKGDFSDLGCAFMALTPEMKKQIGISYGVKVTGLQSGPLKAQGVKDGYIIQEINGEVVKSSDDVERIFNKVMNDPEADKVLMLSGLYPSGKKYWYAIPLED